ncbi:major histocompatibility complex class I-related gene protein-like [Megalops cyprinoides]|uniref:major histocompatibility complex class I-related gene protein-like n=1 Tax=Megalops cyprinoides TaxID=118141 RepID=UPI001863DB71|nr:major histocompatibility complex class I-related gene protein-like [Megalops cyprinoides]XP_036411230.1 major histocompatibility complex class I-related gene protein-like [Megalops cyprinoides]
MIGVLVLLLCGFHAGFAVTDFSRTYLTGTTGLRDLPEFVAVHVVDYETVAYFDSSTRHLQFREKWLQDNLEQKYIDFYNNVLNRAIADLINNLHYVMMLYNQTGGIHTFQLITGCDVSEDGKTGGLAVFGYDGEDFTRLDMSTYTWSGASHQAFIFNEDWNHRADIVQFWKGYLENNCIELLKKSVDYGRESLERKVPPEVSLLRRDPSSPVTCLATGFFPKGIVVSWQKDGEDLHEDVELLETVPNEDGTFQTRSRLTVSPADLKEHKFTCIVDHSSLEKMIIKPVTDRDIKSNQYPENSLPVGIIIAVVLAVLLVAIAAFAWYWKFRMRRGANMLEELRPLRNHSRRGASQALTRSHLSTDQRQGQSGDEAAECCSNSSSDPTARA